ncbi:ribonuclease J [Megalodesulfovibrio paquesii]
MTLDPHVRLTPLGGLGEIGRNCMVLETEKTMLVIDCGLMFPDDYLLGIDIVIPRFDYILEHKDKLKAILLTHGHEDHIGALPWLMSHLDAPIYGSGFTLGLVRNKLREHNLERFTTLHRVQARDRIVFDDVAVNFFPVCHSIVDGFALGFETSLGRILHTGDFKIDPAPMGDLATDMDAIRDFAADGVLCMLSDSTNIERDGHSLNERQIMSSLSEIFKAAQGRILVTLFSSHIQRMQEVFELAWQTGRKVAVAGKSISSNIELAQELRFLAAKEGVHIPLEEVPTVPDRELVLLVTGSQGEPLSALTRITAGEHKSLRIHEGDTVIMSSRFIPGNVRAIYRVINQLYKLGADVFYESIHNIHASGHAYKEELRLMLEAVKPKYFIPIHGEYRHLVKHADLARHCGVAGERAIVLEDGQPLTFVQHGIRFEDAVPADAIYVDGKGVGDVGHTVLKERQLLGGEGLVIVVLVLEETSWEIIHGPQVESKGFVFTQHYSHVLEDAQCIILDIFENVPPGEVDKLKERIRSALRRFFRKVLDRDPVVVPLVMVV